MKSPQLFEALEDCAIKSTVDLQRYFDTSIPAAGINVVRPAMIPGGLTAYSAFVACWRSSYLQSTLCTPQQWNELVGVIQTILNNFNQQLSPSPLSGEIAELMQREITQL
jgi:hypothetical protein